MQKYWCLWKDKCKSAHTCVLQWTLGKQISLTRHGNSHLLPLCVCVAKYFKNVLVFLSHRWSYTQELYHATKVNTNKIWYGNTCGKDFQIKWRLRSHWLIHLASSFQNGSCLWSRCYICGCCEISLNTKEVWNLIREYTGRWDLLCVTNVEKLFKHKPLVIFITNTFTPLTDKTKVHFVKGQSARKPTCSNTSSRCNNDTQWWKVVFHVIKPLEIGGTQ